MHAVSIATASKAAPGYTFGPLPHGSVLLPRGITRSNRPEPWSEPLGRALPGHTSAAFIPDWLQASAFGPRSFVSNSCQFSQLHGNLMAQYSLNPVFKTACMCFFILFFWSECISGVFRRFRIAQSNSRRPEMPWNIPEPCISG